MDLASCLMLKLFGCQSESSCLIVSIVDPISYNDINFLLSAY